MEFIASDVEADPEDDEFLAMVFLRGERDLVPEYLCLCRFTDDQDDGHIEVELSEQTRCTRDGIVRCTLRDGELRLVLDEDAARALDTDPVLVVRFVIDGPSLDRLAATLASLFRDRMERLELLLSVVGPSAP
jgi:hypothetical protein